jgi:hypothetical protein
MLYEIDRKAEGDPVRVAELRRSETVRVLDELKGWLSSMVTLTSLSIGKAAAYTLGNWPKLIRFVDDARVPLDNNQTERGIRRPVGLVSLCISSSSTWDSQGALVAGNSTRTTAPCAAA